MQEQYLDQMELERERGITIKLQPVRMKYKIRNPKHEILNNPKSLEIRNSDLEISDSIQEYELNLIDTPGHVDFSYEVSRSLAAVEGAILLVDASKGIQAQTLANLHLAQKQGLKIVTAINKIDLPNARTEQVREELAHLLNVAPEEILDVSAKMGDGVKELLERVIRQVPSPRGSQDAPLRALIFDSAFDPYKGVLAYVRVFDGAVKRGDKMTTSATRAKADVLEVGSFAPQLTTGDLLSPGEIGYVATGLKDPGLIRVGDTVVFQNASTAEPLPGYRQVRPMVYASFFPENSDDYDLLKDALGKLRLTDAALSYEPESSAGLGRGFRIGFLGMLHVEIISERLRREFGLPLIISSPSVEYRVMLKNGEEQSVRSASMLPDFSKIQQIAEPIVALEIITPAAYLGSVMELASTVRSVHLGTEYLGKETALIRYRVPLAEVITDFYDTLKSVSSGYASMSYEPEGFQAHDLVRLDVMVAGDLVEPFSRIVPRDKAYLQGRALVNKLKEVIPPQWFAVALQAVIGGKVIARETIRARRKDVTGYLYGGDVTRKMKLLEKQKKGKKKMQEVGKVNIPHDVFLKMLKR